ncbi:alpha/beta hydrolase [Paraburkholderia acidisoli]|uniref:Alpha/beta hydrolase fold domain-containing protein n=1 Tax=Paraburkholderia acidisoli TaxID=2571748 RepID=A0A7Z2JFY8_9BURK|nr:alpha/beta hydrolase [Paraburkholderia acidisoli]QGZ63967.1 alpha/beta hydrolase fold domain-containing protein [Paraburkholderia acidisoli]
MDVFKRPLSAISAEEVAHAAGNASTPPAATGVPRASGLITTDVLIEGHAKQIQLRVYRPEGVSGLPVLLYFHGGGFVRGSIEEAEPAGRFLAERLPALVVSVGYSLAPQYPFPAAPEDAHRAALWAIARARAFGGNAKRLIAAGHDAGGQIANVLAFMGRDRGDVKLAAQALFAPMLDPSLTRLGDAARLGSDITASECAACYRAYLPEAAQRMHPYAAPLESRRLAGLPPTLIVTAQNDVLHIEAEKYASRLIDAGVRTQVMRYPSVSHADLATHTSSLNEAVRFFQCCFDAGTSC